MNKSDISTLVDFNFWANGRILAACEQLSPDDFTRPVTPDPGWGNLREILVHALDTEYGWRLNLDPGEPDVILNAADFSHVAALKARWDTEKAAWTNYVADLSPERLKQGFGDDPAQSPRVWQIIMHVVMHSIQHRAEAAALLTGYGHSPGELDFVMFLRENSEQTPD